MKLFKLFNNKRLFILLITLVLFIVVMGFSLGPRKALSWPENFLRDTTGFVQQIFYKPAGYVAGLFEDIGNLRKLAKENEQLKIVVAQYARERAQYNWIQSENERLQKLNNFTEAQKKMYKYEYHTAQVISLNNDPNNSTLVINLGSKDGIRINMTVISDKGLVGVVSNVSNFTSTVKLLTMLDVNDPNSQPAIAATARGRENKSFGMIERYDPATKRLLMNRIAPGDPIQKDDEIVSSGEGGLYPRGLVIGKVESVAVGNGLTSTAVIKPSAEFEDWKELIVVITEERAE